MNVRGSVDAVVVVVVIAAVVVRGSSDSLAGDVAYVGVLVGAGIAACVAAARAPVGHRLVAWLVAAGVALTAVGDTLWEVLDAAGADTGVSVADPPWLAAYVALCAALAIVLRRSGAAREAAFVLDAATIVVVSLLLLGSNVVGPIVTDSDVPALVRVVWVTYPVADAVLLALVVRILTSRVARVSMDPGFVVGICLWLTVDLMFLHQLDGATATVVMDAGWMVAPVLIARSLWHVSVPGPPGPAPRRREDRTAQLVVAVAPLLVPPAIEIAADLGGRPDRPVLLVVGAVTLTLIAFLRMALLVRSEEQARLEAEEARDEALQASAAKSRFVGTVSHEVRTPLTVVLAAAELLQDSGLDEQQAGLVRRLRRSGTALTRLVDELLDFSRLESGDLHVEARPFDLAALVDDLAQPAQARARAAGLELVAVVDTGPSTGAVGDPARVEQVVDTLLDNAIRFTEEGQVRLDVRRVASEPDLVEVAVTDTGIGIPAEHCESIFDSFHVVDSSCTSDASGVGLGLSICRELTGLMGGTVTVSSRPGVGSEFVARMRLPVP